MAQSTISDGFTDLTLNDLQDPTLFRLNQSIRRLYGKIGTFFIPNNVQSYPTVPTFQTVKASSQATPPSDPTEFLTRGSADQLYGPTAQRQALLTGSYPGANGSQTEQSTIQRLPPSSSSGGGGTGAAGILKVIIAASPTNINSPGTPSDGQLLAVFISQDGAGHHTITWDAMFKGAPVNISGTPNTTNVFWFVGASGLWWLAGVPIIGTAGVP